MKKNQINQKHPGSTKKPNLCFEGDNAACERTGGGLNHPPTLLVSPLFSGPWLTQVQRHGAKHDIKPG